MALLNKQEAVKLRNWTKLIIDDNNKINIICVKAYNNDNLDMYITIDLLDDNNNVLDYIQLDKEYKTNEEMTKESKKVRSEAKRKLNLNFNLKIEIINCII